MKPLTSDLNLTPSSTAFGSATEGLAGVADGPQTPHGHSATAAVVKDQVRLAGSGLPAASLTVGVPAPPRNVAV